MNEYDVKRLALVLAIQAEIEGMKAVNQQRAVFNSEPGYGIADFEHMADKLRTIAHLHNDQL
jgi:hypothetical protein